MRQYALVAGLGLLLALGACAAQKSTRDGIAPSRAASPLKPLDESQYYAPSESDGQGTPKAKEKEQEVMQAAYANPDANQNKPAVEHVPVESAADAAKTKPLVPAFPAKMEQDKLRDMKTVFFLFDKAELTSEAKDLLQANAKWLKANPNVRVRVEGHCDERGTSEYNLALGSRRSNQVRDYLVSLGVSPYVLDPVSFGEEMPLKAAHDEGAWRTNRRVQFSPVEGPRPASAQVETDSRPKL